MLRMKYVLIYLFLINMIAILAIALDKSAARNGEARVKESSLLVVAAIGGGIGMYVAMRIFHHKTRKNKFMIGIPAMVLTEIGLLIIFYFNFFK